MVLKNMISIKSKSVQMEMAGFGEFHRRLMEVIVRHYHDSLRLIRKSAIYCIDFFSNGVNLPNECCYLAGIFLLPVMPFFHS